MKANLFYIQYGKYRLLQAEGNKTKINNFKRSVNKINLFLEWLGNDVVDISTNNQNITTYVTVKTDHFPVAKGNEPLLAIPDDVLRDIMDDKDICTIIDKPAKNIIIMRFSDHDHNYNDVDKNNKRPYEKVNVDVRFG